MNSATVVHAARRLLDARLFDLAGTTVTLGTLLTVATIVLLTMYLSRLLQRGLRGAFSRRGLRREGTVGALSSLVHYVVLVVGFGIAAQTLGIKLSTLFAAGAVFAVGLGFAMQNIAQNFVSGVILLVERSIKTGDVLDVGGTVVRVVETRIRSTIVRSRDGEELIVPNSLLVQSTVKNYTLKDASYRLRVPVGVVYASDMDLVFSVLQQAANSVPWRLAEPEPMVLMTAFGDNSVNFEVAIWMDDPWSARPAQSKLHKAIWDAFKQHQIVIAFPQLDVHFDPPVNEQLKCLASAR